MKKRLVGKRLTGVLLSMSMLALAAPGFAENRAGTFNLSPYVGGYTFDHDQRYQNLENSPIFGIRAGYNFTENWGAEARFGYVLAEHRAANYPEADVYSFGIDALYHFNPSGSFVPYLAAGVGGIHHNYPANGPGYYPEYAFNAGLGFKQFVADNVALRADARYIRLPDDKLNNLEYTVGVTFQFGGTPKATPAIAEVQPCSPAVVVVTDTTAPYVTLTSPTGGSNEAPVNGKVLVGFSEEMDSATINSNTFTLHQAEKRIPGKVKASTDMTASFTPESDLTPGTNYTGSVTTEAKDVAGNRLAKDYAWKFKTASTPEPVVITKTETRVQTKIINKFVMLSGTHFAFDSADINPEGKKLVKEDIKIMQDNPDVRVRIAGHTSAAGSEKYNQALSERRAESVKDYMVTDGGIAADRIETIGYGETRPAMKETNPKDLRSKAAKANMRVVFEVLEK